MDALIGALAGASVAWAAQYVTRRSEVRERQGNLLLEQCALIVALSEDYRNRVWEPPGGSGKRSHGQRA